MTRLTRFLYSKLKEPLVNEAKRNTSKRQPELIYGNPNTTASSVSSGQVAAEAVEKSETVSKSLSEKGGFSTASRSQFAEAYPRLHKLQEFHISQLKSGKPVHISGQFDTSINLALYVFSGLGLVYCMYLFEEHIRHT